MSAKAAPKTQRTTTTNAPAVKKAPAATPAPAAANVPTGYHPAANTPGVQTVTAVYKREIGGHKVGDLKETYDLYDFSVPGARDAFEGFMDLERAEFIAILSAEDWNAQGAGQAEHQDPANWRNVTYSFNEDDANTQMALALAGPKGDEVDGAKVGDIVEWSQQQVDKEGKVHHVAQKRKIAPTVIVSDSDCAYDFLSQPTHGPNGDEPVFGIITHRPLVGGGVRDHLRFMVKSKVDRLIAAADLATLMPQPGGKRRAARASKAEPAEGAPETEDSADDEVENADEPVVLDDQTMREVEDEGDEEEE